MKFFLVSAAAVLALSACTKDDTRAADRADAAAAAASAAAAVEPVRAAAPPASAPAPVRAAVEVERKPTAPVSHTVARGETLSSIARTRGIGAADLARWNNIQDARRLRIGQELRLTAP